MYKKRFKDIFVFDSSQKVAATSGKATTTRENNIFNSISQLEANVNV